MALPLGRPFMTTRSRIRNRRDDAELGRASIAVDYEANMMGTTLHLLIEGDVNIDSEPAEQCIANSLLHAFLIATRNLTHFLYSHEPRSTDVIAEDFFEDPSDWHRKRPILPEEFTNGSFVDRISKRLMHLTWERASGTKPTWGAFRIAWELGKALEAFVTTVNPNRVAKELIEDVSLLRASTDGLQQVHGSIEEVERIPSSMLFHEDDFWVDPQRAPDEWEV